MTTIDDAVDAYNTLSRYLAQECFPRSRTCKKCPFLRFDGYTCLIKRMGTYPQLSVDVDAKASIMQNMVKLKEQHHEMP